MPPIQGYDNHMKLDERKLVFADCEGNDFLPKLSKMWTIQLGIGVDGEVVVFADQPNHEPIKDALAILKEAPAYVFHNGFGYDHFAINKLYPGTMDPRKMIDTLVISRLMDSTATRHSLADIGEALGYPKGDYEDFSQFTEEMVKYGRRDVEILQRAWTGDSKNGRKFNPFGKFYSDYEKACDLEFKTSYVIQKQVNHGFHFDLDGALMLESELRQEQKDLEGKLQEIFPPITFERRSEKTGKRLKDGVDVFNPGSRDQIAKRLIDKYGWKPTALTETKKPKVDETILEELPYPEAKEMARYMKLGKKLGMLSDGDNSWIKLAEQEPNGVFIHGQVNTLGARTHRMSHYKPNVAQVDKDHRMRSLFMADAGQVLVGIDAEGLELRMLAHYLAPYDGGAFGEAVHKGDKKLGTDAHTLNMKAAGLHLRDSAKTMIYALVYGAGDKKLGQVVTNDAREAGFPDPVGSLSKIGADLRERIATGIKGYAELLSKCQRTHKKYGALPGIDGRWIPSISDHSALNTLLQGNGAIAMKQAEVLFDESLDKAHIKVGFCATVHDEYDVSCAPEYAHKVADLGKQAITDAGVLLGIRCPLVGDAKIGANWYEVH